MGDTTWQWDSSCLLHRVWMLSNLPGYQGLLQLLWNWKKCIWGEGCSEELQFFMSQCGKNSERCKVIDCVCVWVAQSCLTLCDPIDCSPPGSLVHGILQARVLGWVAISFSIRLPVCACVCVCVCVCVSVSHSVVSDSLWPHGLQPTRLPHPWDSPDKNTGVGCHFLLQSDRLEAIY